MIATSLRPTAKKMYIVHGRREKEEKRRKDIQAPS